MLISCKYLQNCLSQSSSCLHSFACKSSICILAQLRLQIFDLQAALRVCKCTKPLVLYACSALLSSRRFASTAKLCSRLRTKASLLCARDSMGKVLQKRSFCQGFCKDCAAANLQFACTATLTLATLTLATLLCSELRSDCLQTPCAQKLRFCEASPCRRLRTKPEVL